MPTIGNAPSGEKTQLDGTEKIPASASVFFKGSTMRDYVNAFAKYTGGVVTIANGAGGSGTIPIDSAEVDAFSLCNLHDSDDKLYINEAGWYEIDAGLGHYSNGSDYNGTINIGFEGVGAINAIAELRGYVTAWAVSSDDFVLHIPLAHVVSDNTSYIKLIAQNNSGQSIDVYLNYISVKRLKLD